VKYNIGTYLMCVDNVVREDDLLLGKSYEVLDSRDMAVKVQTENFVEDWFTIDRFVEITESKPQPQVLDNEQIYMFDVDDTLICWDDKYFGPAEGRVAVTDPYDGVTVYLKPHSRHVKLLTQMAGRGRFVIVWSQSGAQWARAVVDALGIQEHVRLIMTKPQGYVDDLPCERWMRDRIFLENADKEAV
jgi:hypothetical protein